MTSQIAPERRNGVGPHLCEGGVVLDRYEPLDIDFYSTGDRADYRVTFDLGTDLERVEEFVRYFEAERAKASRVVPLVGAGVVVGVLIGAAGGLLLGAVIW